MLQKVQHWVLLDDPPWNLRELWPGLCTCLGLLRESLCDLLVDLLQFGVPRLQLGLVHRLQFGLVHAVLQRSQRR